MRTSRKFDLVAEKTTLVDNVSLLSSSSLLLVLQVHLFPGIYSDTLVCMHTFLEDSMNLSKNKKVKSDCRR